MTKPRPFSTPTSIVKSRLMNPEMEPHKTLWRCPSRSRVTSPAYPHTHTPNPNPNPRLQSSFSCTAGSLFVCVALSLCPKEGLSWRVTLCRWLQRLYGRLRKCWTKISVLEALSVPQDEIVFLVSHNRTNDVISDRRRLVKADDKDKQVTTAAKHRNLVCIAVTVFGIQLPCTYYGV